MSVCMWLLVRVCFSCHEVSGLFCRVEQQLASVISILSKIKYDNDESLLKLEEVLNHLHRRWIAEHLQQFVYICPFYSFLHF